MNVAVRNMRNRAEDVRVCTALSAGGASFSASGPFPFIFARFLVESAQFVSFLIFRRCIWRIGGARRTRQLDYWISDISQLCVPLYTLTKDVSTFLLTRK